MVTVRCGQWATEPEALAAGAQSIVTLEEQIADAVPWTPDLPYLYTARVTLRAGGDPADEIEVRFGFRTVELREAQLLLNGAPIFLTGFNRHEDSPRTAMATDLDTVRQDLLDMKAAGANFVRLCHYPHHPGELDLCDEFGLLVMGEIPLYGWRGYDHGAVACWAKREAAMLQLKKMIERDINHPSVIFWSVGNETAENRPEVAETNRDLIRLARQLDSSRMCVHVTYLWRQVPAFEEDDVICINSHPSLARGVMLGDHDYDLAESTAYWREELALLHSKFPGKPILITEWGYWSLEDTFGHACGEDLHARVLEAEFEGLDSSYVCGATIWAWANHAWPPGVFDCGSNFSPYGVVGRDRHKGLVYQTVKRLYRARRGLSLLEQPETVSDSRWLTMVRTSLTDVPDVPFPEGFQARALGADGAGLWEDIARDAARHGYDPGDAYERSFGANLRAAQWRCFLIVDEAGVSVGTIAAWYDKDFDGEEYGVGPLAHHPRPALF